MKALHRTVFGIIAAVGLVWAAHAAAETGAETFVKGIYANYIGTGMTAMGVPLDNEAVVRRYFEPSLAQLILKDRADANGEVGALDGDPFVDAQDWEIKSFDVARRCERPR